MFLHILLSLPLAVVEVTAYGAVADDSVSDSQAFRDAFAAAGNGDTVHAGCGVWDLPKIDSLSAVYVTGETNVTFDGDGTCTVLKQAGGTHIGDYHVFNLYANTNLTFKDFVCDGNRSNIVSADEQTHCINLWDVNGFTMHDMQANHMWGDGIKVIGTSANVYIHDVTMDDNGRSGIAVHQVATMTIEDFVSTNISDSGIDTEPPAQHFISNFTVRRVDIGSPTTYGAAVFSLSRGDNMAVYDSIIRGCVHGVQSYGVLLDHVTILATGAGGGCDAVSFNDQTDVTMNRVNIEARDARHGIHAASTTVDGNGPPTNWNLNRVRITVTDGKALDFENGGAGELTLTSLRIRSSHPSRHAGTGAYISNVYAETPMDNVSFVDLDITGMQYGMMVLRNFSANIVEVLAAGTITLASPVGVGVTCSNITGGSSFDRTGLITTAVTPNNGCP